MRLSFIILFTSALLILGGCASAEKQEREAKIVEYTEYINNIDKENKAHKEELKALGIAKAYDGKEYALTEVGAHYYFEDSQVVHNLGEGNYILMVVYDSSSARKVGDNVIHQGSSGSVSYANDHVKNSEVIDTKASEIFYLAGYPDGSAQQGHIFSGSKAIIARNQGLYNYVDQDGGRVIPKLTYVADYIAHSPSAEELAKYDEFKEKRKEAVKAGYTVPIAIKIPVMLVIGVVLLPVLMVGAIFGVNDDIARPVREFFWGPDEYR